MRSNKKVSFELVKKISKAAELTVNFSPPPDSRRPTPNPFAPSLPAADADGDGNVGDVRSSGTSCADANEATARRQARARLGACRCAAAAGGAGDNGNVDDSISSTALAVVPTSTGFAASGVAAARLYAGTGFTFDEEGARRQSLANLKRAWHPDGGVRQAFAALADDDRRPGLAEVTVPALVIHGTEDPLVVPQGGQETADAIPGAELVWIEGMGHEMPEAAWPQILDPISALIARAETL